MGYIIGVNLLPSTGEFTYDTIPYLGQRVTETRLTSINRYANGGPLAGTGTVTDYSIALNKLQAAVSRLHDRRGRRRLVRQFDRCHRLPDLSVDHLHQRHVSAGLRRLGCLALLEPDAIVAGPHPDSAGRRRLHLRRHAVGSIDRPLHPRSEIPRAARRLLSVHPDDGERRALARPHHLQRRRTFPARRRPRSTISSAAPRPRDFTPDTTNLTVAYSGSPTDYTYRRMILHYANLCVVAGGVDLFLLGSEFRGLEVVRGPAWTKAGTVSGGTTHLGLSVRRRAVQLASDVRTVFNNAGLTKDTTNLHNLIAYSADWSVWMGYQHPGENGQWPHLDQLYASSNIDLVSFDNYLPLSDWTTGNGGLDAENWLEPAPTGAWPPGPSAFNGLGMSGQPTIYSHPVSESEHRRRRKIQLVL